MQTIDRVSIKIIEILYNIGFNQPKKHIKDYHRNSIKLYTTILIKIYMILLKYNFNLNHVMKITLS